MGKRRHKGFYGNFNRNFGNMRKNITNYGCFKWFTPVRGCICSAIFLTLILSGVSLYGIVIIGLLLVIMQLIC